MATVYICRRNSCGWIFSEANLCRTDSSAAHVTLFHVLSARPRFQCHDLRSIRPSNDVRDGPDVLAGSKIREHRDTLCSEPHRQLDLVSRYPTPDLPRTESASLRWYSKQSTVPLPG